MVSNEGTQGQDMAPWQFSDFGRTAKDLLTKDYVFEHRLKIQVPSYDGMGITATGFKNGQIFNGDVQYMYKSGNIAVQTKLDIQSNLSTKVTVSEALPGIKTALSFKIPDHKSSKLDLHYINHHATVNSSMGLNPAPLLEFNATVGTKDLSLGGEVGFDTASGLFTECNVGICFSKPDLSAALILMDKGQVVKTSYIHNLNHTSAVAAEMTHRLSGGYQNRFRIGSSHAISDLTLIKTRLSSEGEVGMLCQHEWRPKSRLTFSCALDTKANHVSNPKLGLAVALEP